MSGALPLLRELLCIDTTNPPGREAPAAELLEARLTKAGLSCELHKSPGGRPNLVARLEGPRDVPALVLLSHTDVVGVEREHWSHDPFGGEIDEGFVWGRGALDMKAIAAMHVEAAAAVVRDAATVAREVIVVAVADEEAGGSEGAAWLTREHAEGLGFGDDRPAPEVLGEGAFGLQDIVDRPVMPVAFGEKTAVWLDVTAHGDPGHGALPPLRQAPVQLAHATAALAGFRRPRVHPVMAEQMRLLAPMAGPARRNVMRLLAGRAGNHAVRALHGVLARSGPVRTLLADSVTPTQIAAGYKNNVVPSTAKASFDCRILPDTSVEEFAEDLRKRASIYEVDIEIRRSHGGPVSGRTRLFDAIAGACGAMRERPIVVPTLSPGFTDVRHFRALGATGYGWAPVVLSSDLLSTIHGHDERIEVEAFHQGVDVMKRLVLDVST
jgi:acetylornithine deacetylase/succinyl-diaminopimelate desuccinylase-like protein